MNDQVNKKRPDEQKLVKMYMELTGATEAEARGVFMYVCSCNGKLPGRRGQTVLESEVAESPAA